MQEGYKLTALTLSEEATGSIADALPLASGTLADIFQGNARQAAAAAAQQVSSCVHLNRLPQAVAYLLTQVDLQTLFEDRIAYLDESCMKDGPLIVLMKSQYQYLS